MGDRIRLGDCPTCYGPIYAKTRWELLRDELAYDLWMALPSCLAFSRFGYWILGYGGGHAFACTCPNKVLDQAKGGAG